MSSESGSIMETLRELLSKLSSFSFKSVEVKSLEAVGLPQVDVTEKSPGSPVQPCSLFP